jgi:hypothetical protein
MKNSTLLLPSHIYRRRPENNGKVNASIKAHTERTFGEITMMLMMALKKIISYTFFSVYFFCTGIIHAGRQLLRHSVLWSSKHGENTKLFSLFIIM